MGSSPVAFNTAAESQVFLCIGVGKDTPFHCDQKLEIGVAKWEWPGGSGQVGVARWEWPGGSDQVGVAWWEWHGGSGMVGVAWWE